MTAISLDTTQASASRRGTPFPWRTWSPLAVLLVLSIVTTWMTNVLVLDPETLARMAPGANHTASQVEFFRKLQMWSLLTLPVSWAMRLGVLALMVQMACLIGGRDVKLSIAFHCVTWTGFVTVLGTVLRLVFLRYMVDPSDLSAAMLNVTPSSLASVLLAPDDERHFLYALLSVIGLLDLIWVGALALALEYVGKLRWRTAIGAAIAVWTVVAVCQIAMATYGAAVTSPVN